MQEHPSILWSFRMMSCRAMGEALFSVVYGAEIVLPVEIGVKIAWVLTCMPKGSVAIRVEELDFVKERRI